MRSKENKNCAGAGGISKIVPEPVGFQKLCRSRRDFKNCAGAGGISKIVPEPVGFQKPGAGASEISKARRQTKRTALNF